MNTGPCWNSKDFIRRLNTLEPVMSMGSRSGVNWIRLKPQAMVAAMERASIVFPTPGTSSRST